MVKKYIVTGGAGFIGVHLIGRLLNEGNKVICIDNFSTSAKHHKEEYYKLEKNNTNFEILNYNIEQLDCNTINFLKIQESKLDGIYHLACPASPVKYQAKPYTTMMTCYMGTNNMLDIAFACKCPILLASTSEIYGEPLESPQKEEYKGNVSCNGPRSMYDEGKRGMEAMGEAHKKQYGTNVKTVRIFNTYGPQMAEDDGRVISNFIMAMIEGKKPEIYGSGKQTRSFCYVSDLVDGMVKMMNSKESGPINLGNPECKLTIIELLKYIHFEMITDDKDKMMGEKMLKYEDLCLYGYLDKIDINKIVKFKPSLKDDPTNRQPDITKAKELLGWEPKVDISEGLRETIRYFRIINKK